MAGLLPYRADLGGESHPRALSFGARGREFFSFLGGTGDFCYWGGSCKIGGPQCYCRTAHTGHFVS